MVWSRDRYPEVTLVPRPWVKACLAFLLRFWIYCVLPISLLLIRKLRSSSPGTYLTNWLALTRLTMFGLFLLLIWLSWPILTWDAILPVSCFFLFSSYFFCFIACLSRGAKIWSVVAFLEFIGTFDDFLSSELAFLPLFLASRLGLRSWL